MIGRYYLALDAGGASGVSCVFAASTAISGSATFYQETENLTGAAGAIVTLQVTTYSNTNTLGQLLVNSVQLFLNSTFTVTLDGSGNGSFLARVQGDAAQAGTIVRGIFNITSVSIGQIGGASTKQISKAF